MVFISITVTEIFDADHFWTAAEAAAEAAAAEAAAEAAAGQRR